MNLIGTNRLARCLVLCARENRRATLRKDAVTLRTLHQLQAELTQLFEEQTSGRLLEIVLKEDVDPVLDEHPLPHFLKEQAS